MRFDGYEFVSETGASISSAAAASQRVYLRAGARREIKGALRPAPKYRFEVYDPIAEAKRLRAKRPQLDAPYVDLARIVDAKPDEQASAALRFVSTWGLLGLGLATGTEHSGDASWRAQFYPGVPNAHSLGADSVGSEPYAEPIDLILKTAGLFGEVLEAFAKKTSAGGAAVKDNSWVLNRWLRGVWPEFRKQDGAYLQSFRASSLIAALALMFVDDDVRGIRIIRCDYCGRRIEAAHPLQRFCSAAPGKKESQCKKNQNQKDSRDRARRRG